MNGVLVMYKVEDFDKWNLNNEEGAGIRRTLGSKEANVYSKIKLDKRAENRRTFHSEEADVYYRDKNSDEYVVLYKWDDLDKAREYFESDEFKNQLQDAGVDKNPEIVYLAETERLIG